MDPKKREKKQRPKYSKRVIKIMEKMSGKKFEDIPIRDEPLDYEPRIVTLFMQDDFK